jgi:hypothetical protein
MGRNSRRSVGASGSSSVVDVWDLLRSPRARGGTVATAWETAAKGLRKLGHHDLDAGVMKRPSGAGLAEEAGQTGDLGLVESARWRAPGRPRPAGIDPRAAPRHPGGPTRRTGRCRAWWDGYQPATAWGQVRGERVRTCRGGGGRRPTPGSAFGVLPPAGRNRRRSAGSAG